MPVQGRLVEDDNGTLVIEIKEEDRKKAEKFYEQLEFDFDIAKEDNVAPI